MIRFILIASLFAMWSCKAYKPQTGDLLFQDMDCGPMCDAIEAVTQGAEGAKFSHIGIVKVTNDTTCIT